MCKRFASMRLNVYSAVAAVARGEELSAGGGNGREQWDAVCRRDVRCRHGMTTGKGIKKAALSRGKSRLKIG